MERTGVEMENGGPLTAADLKKIWPSSMLLDQIA